MKNLLLVVLFGGGLFFLWKQNQGKIAGIKSLSTSVPYSKYMVTIEGDKSVGTGFFALLKGKPCLFTNTHVLSGNTKIKIKTLDGKEVPVKGIAMANTLDVSVVFQDVVSNGAAIYQNIEEGVNIGDEVVVLGNSLGGGVVTEITGKVTGIGPELVEVDARFVPGNSGSPIVHKKSGKVIGIATYVTVRNIEGVGKDSRFNNTPRYFGCRVDNISSWRNTTWPQFVKETEAVEAIHKRTSDVWALAEDIATNGKITNKGGYLSPDNIVTRHIADFRRAVTRQNLTRSEYLNAKKNLLYWLKNELKKDLNNMNLSSTEYHKKKIESDKADREVLRQYFEYLDQGLNAL